MSKYIFDYLMERIGNAKAVAALMGNLDVESGLNPVNLEGKYARKFNLTSREYTDLFDKAEFSELDSMIHDCAGYGIAQWTFWSRKKGLYDYAKSVHKSVGDLDAQLGYLWKEIQGYKAVMQLMKESDNLREISDIIAIKYERPEHTEEKYLANRAAHGQKFYDMYANQNGSEKGENTMYDYKESEAIIQNLINLKASKPDIVVAAANSELAWPYVWGAVGKRMCTVANRKSYMNSPRISQGDIELIKKKCQILNGSKTNCDGCIYFPNNVGVFIGDCQGFIKRIFGYVGITFSGGGCTSMWNTASNWEATGTIDTMPKDKVCCVFRDVKGVKEHILLYDGHGNYIHDSVEVKKQSIDTYKATHWAIPKGLYDGGVVPPVPETKPTLRKGSKGSYVTELQNDLIALLYSVGGKGADGIFGSATEIAVKEFQRDHNLKVDGIVGTATWTAIDNALAPLPPAPDPSTKLYTVTIPHLNAEQADELLSEYFGAMKVEE